VRDLARTLGGALVAVLLLAWVLRGTDLGDVGRTLAGASVGLVAAAVALNLASLAFRAWRWRALLDPFRPDLPFRPLFAAIAVGYMTSWIVPGRLGEVVRPLLLAGRERVPLGPCLGSVVADRLLDGVTIVAMFAVATFITPLEGPAAEYVPIVRGAAAGMLVLSVAVAGAMLAVAGSERRLRRWTDSRSRVVRWVGRTAVAVSGGVHALRSPRLLVRLAVHSALAWSFIAAATWAAVRSVGAEIGIAEVLILQPMLALGVAVPTPGGAGSYHGAVKVGLVLFGVAEVQAVSAGVIAHAIITVPLILLGTALLWTERISWRELLATAAQLRRLGSHPVAAERPVENVS